MHNNNNNNKLHDIEAIKWAFEKGYFLGLTDAKDGIHINFDEVQKYFLAELDIEFFNNLADSNKIFFEIIIFIILFLLVYITYSILEKAINIKSPTQLEFKIIDIIVGAIYGLLIFTFLFYISFTIFLNKHIKVYNPIIEFNISFYEKLLNKKTENNLNINEKNDDKVPKKKSKKSNELY